MKQIFKTGVVLLAISCNTKTATQNNSVVKITYKLVSDTEKVEQLQDTFSVKTPFGIFKGSRESMCPKK